MNTTMMKSKLWQVALLVAGLALTGCASRNSPVSDSIAEYDRESMSAADRFRHDYRSPAMARLEDDLALAQSGLIKAAKTALGTPYVRGGTTTEGFDCSGFVQWAYRHVGVKLPRTAREQAAFGKAIRNEDDMVAGDIVAFKHPRRGYHTGIYVGDGKFIHSPRKRKAVQINSLDDPYFSTTFLGARRVAVSSDDDIQAAQVLLAQYESGKNRIKVRSDMNSGKRADFTSKKESSKSKKKETLASRSKKSKKSETRASRSSKKNAQTQVKATASAASTKKNAASASSKKKISQPSKSKKSEKVSTKRTSARQSSKRQS